MKAKTICLFFLILLCGSLLSGYAQQIKVKKPIVSINMETGNVSNQLYSFNGKDSIVEGINEKAKYLSGSAGNDNYILIKNNETLSSLWKDQDFSIEVWVQTKAQNKEFQVIASNKDWNSGDIKDFTDNRYAGLSRTTGLNKGWAIICQQDGSWAWNIGNGKYGVEKIGDESNRNDYRPTAPRQKINDGEWHYLVFTINREANEARIYFDGLNVAIYYMGPVKDMDTGLPVGLATDALANNPGLSFNGALDEFNISDYVLSAEEVAQKYESLVPVANIPRAQKQRVEKLNLLQWNIWHGGRRLGKEIGPQQIIDFIKETNTDIVTMEETYGSGPLIADALGYYYYLSSSNISIMSRYPIEKTWIVYHELWSGIATIQLSENQKINIAGIWLHYLPAWSRNSREPDATVEKLLAGEAENRHREIKIILKKLEPQISQADEIPFIIGGDFNSPSHKDWVSSTSDWHNNLVVEWPVSKEMQNAGFKDSFREIRPDLNYFSPSISAERLSWRIDYIYYKGKNLKAVDSDMHYEYKGVWPSDHPAVTTTILIDQMID